MSALFGSDSGTSSKPAASWLGGSPPDQSPPQKKAAGPETPMVKWARNVVGVLKRENQEMLDKMRRSTNLAQGGTPWWRGRPKWKIGTKLNFCATVPLAWKAILCDAQPSVSYTALDRKKQKRADIATAAFNQAYTSGKWQRTIGDTILVSRVQGISYLRLTYDPLEHGGRGRPNLTKVLGEQVLKNKNSTCIDDAEIVFYEYPESYGSVCARFDGLRERLSRKYDTPRNDRDGAGSSTLAPPASYSLGNGKVVNTPPYAASPNSPAGAGGSSGILVWEFWTRPHKTITVDEVQFLASGEPATQPKMYETIDEVDSEPLRRIVTEGGVIYELPESLVSAMYDAQDAGGIRILEDRPALEAVMHKVKYPLYPDGRLVTIVDEDLEVDDRMNPLGYFPFAEIRANSDPGGGTCGPSDVDLIADAYEQLIRLICLVFDTANLSGNSIWRILEDDERSNDDITNAPAAIYRESAMSLKLAKREPAPELPQYIILHIKWLVEQIKELSGLSDVALGKMPPKTQISTETSTSHQEASGVRFRDSLTSISLCMMTLGEQFLELMARFYTAPIIVKVKNEAGVDEPTPMLGAYLTDPFIVEAKAGSRQPSGPTARLNTLLNLKNVGVPIDIETIFNLLEELGSIPSASATLRRIEMLMKDPSQRWKLLGLPQPGQQAKKPGSKRQRKAGATAG